MQVSCVVLGWNEYPTFVNAIERVRQDLQNIEHEIIFVDNGSTDSTSQWLKSSAAAGIICIELPENTGTGKGFNVGFDKASGKYIFYLCGDILPTVGSITALKEYLDKHDDADYVGINPWISQEQDKSPLFNGLDSVPRQGLGNYAFSYAMFRCECLDDGFKLADTGPFSGPGCGFEDAEGANLMYLAGRKCYLFNHPEYYHKRRDFRRSGHQEEKKASILNERRQWLRARWPGQAFDIVHHQEQPPERHVRRVAVVYKASLNRPGPGGHLLNALRGICVAEQFEPGSEPHGWDDYFYVDNGDYDYFVCPEHCHPSTFWFIDMMTPWQDWRPSLKQCVKRARTFDTVYAAQPSAVEYFKEHGVDATWLPLAANSEYHKPHSVETAYDWVALWHHCGERIPYIQHLEGTNGFVGFKDGAEYSKWLCRGRCALSLSRSNELILRVFETMATGVPLVTDRARGLDMLFAEGKHYLGFDSPDEMAAQIDWVKDNQAEAAEMAARARIEVLSKHTFYHRVLTIYGGA